MTLTPDELAAMGERHESDVSDHDHSCRECWQDWPCDSRRLLDEIAALEEEPAVKELMLRDARIRVELDLRKAAYDRIRHLENVLREITAFPRPWIARDVDVIQSIIDAALNHPPMIGESDAGETAASVRHVGGVSRGEAE